LYGCPGRFYALRVKKPARAGHAVSFSTWRAAQRRQFVAELDRLRRGQRTGGHRPASRWGRSKRRWRLGSLVLAASAGLAVGMVAWQALTTVRVQGAETTAHVPAVEVLRGRVSDGHSVIDGDTLKIGGQSIRLYGIDAPERRQTCQGWKAGEAARDELVAIVAAGAPRCERMTTDAYGRTVAICRINGKDVGAAMVRSGMAWANTTYSPRYLREEGQARSERVGVHTRRCASPAAWRASHPR
jgi:endonuclease YncB( thermonuclease family)